MVFAPLSIVLAALAIRGGTRSLRAVRIIAGLLALGEIPAGILATTDPSIWWKLEPECGIVYCGLAHTLSHWSHVPLLVAIALAARSAGAHRPLRSPDALPELGALTSSLAPQLDRHERAALLALGDVLS